MRRSRRRWAFTAEAVVLLALAGCASPSSALPTGFPASVPVVSGTVLATSVADGEFKVWVGASDPLAAYRRARAALLKAGYDETHNDESAGGDDGQFCDPSWCVSITGYHDPQHGDSVYYDVFRTSGFDAPKAS